jgi:hypothetical protein
VVGVLVIVSMLVLLVLMELTILSTSNVLMLVLLLINLKTLYLSKLLFFLLENLSHNLPMLLKVTKLP